MTFYEELQLNQKGSKELIKNASDFTQKLRHTAVYLFKIMITMLFCITFVITFTILFGNENSIVGVVILLFVLVFRNVDLNIDTSHALISLAAIFLILAIGPRLSNSSSIGIELIVNSISIFLLMLLGCHNIKTFNQSTLVLSYLLLYGYDVSGAFYIKRLEGLALGLLITGIIYYRNHRGKAYNLQVRHLVKAFNLYSARTRWQLALTIAVSSVLFFCRLIHLPRPMWAAIAVMSIMVPFHEQKKQRAKSRIIGNIFGTFLFFLIYTYLPDIFYHNIGIIGGICVGLSATYGFQAVFNAFGAISAATAILGFPAALFYRIFNNAFGSLYALYFNKCFYKMLDYYCDNQPIA